MTTTAKVLLVSHNAPSAVGHGGKHRALQLEHDVCAAVGAGSVAAVNLELWWQAPRTNEHSSSRIPVTIARKVRGLRKHFRILADRVRAIEDNPYRVFGVDPYPYAIPFSPSWVGSEFIEHYARVASRGIGPRVCIIEHADFADVIDINMRLGIPTVSAFQNLEALDVTRFDTGNRKKVYAVMTDLGNELRLLARCAERLAISKVEAGFMGGLGLDCHYYPYLPVGPLKESLVGIQRLRMSADLERGLVVLLGTAAHGVTGDSMRWFVTMAAEHGLPCGVNVVAVGLGTDKLLRDGRTVPGLELRGWLDQSDLDALLARASAAVIPQRLGFGALTRLAELACAGLPVITFSHPALAVNPTPGLRIVPDQWADLSAALRDAARHPVTICANDYARWEADQPRPLESVLRRLLPA